MIPSETQSHRDLRITAYNTNLGFLSERRQLSVTRGVSRIEITDIPALIDPTSVHLTPLQGDLRVLEQDFQYDMAGPDRILERYLDHPIEALLKNGDLKSGELLSHGDGMLVLRSDDGVVGLILRSEVVDTRLPCLPEGLRTRPTLVWWLESPATGEVDVEFSYLTEGVSWHAEYVGIASEDDSQFELGAWISLENRCGASFADARLQLVAGDVHRVPRPARADDMESPLTLGIQALSVQEEALFEYHLYTFDRIVTIADRETKQLALFPSTTTPVTKSYLYEGGRHSRAVRVLMEIENREEQGLGMPLPAGKFRTYKRDSRGELHFIGEDQVDHTPRNERVQLKVGTAFDVVGERKVVSEKRVSGEVSVEEVEIRIRNRKHEPIEVTVREQLWRNWRILKSTHDYTPHSATSVDFTLNVPADKEELLKFSYRHGV